MQRCYLQFARTIPIRFLSGITHTIGGFAGNNILDLLDKAMQKGEISLSEYYYELMVFYDNKEELLNMEKEFNITLAKLNKYSL